MSPITHSDNNYNKGTLMTREDIGGIMVALDHLSEGNKYLRTQLDDHIKDGVKVERHRDQRHTDVVVQLAELSTKVGSMDEKMDTQGEHLSNRMKGLVAGISTVVSLSIAAVAAWAGM